MKGILKNYALTIAMLGGVLLGGLCGAFFPGVTPWLKPFGDIFLNLLFTLVIPMVFCSITLSFFKLRSGGGVASILFRTLVTFVVMWALSGAVSYFGTLLYNPFDSSVSAAVSDQVSGSGSRADAFVSAFSVPDFPKLFSKYSILPLIIFSALLGVGSHAAGEKGRKFANLLDSCNEVIIKSMDMLMYLAPIGLGCYFAASVASMGTQLMGGYLRAFVLYCGIAVLFFFVLNPLLVLISKGKAALKTFWRNILPPSITAFATASSSIAMPGNIEAAERIGVDKGVAGAVVPLATNLLKAGSVSVAVIKVSFLMAFCGMGAATPASIGIALLAAVVTGAVANGGVTGDILICTLLGVDPAFAGVLMIIGTIVDIPATLVNSQSNVVAAVLTDKWSSK